MNEKTLVEIYVPVAQRTWDVWLPNDLSMGEVFSLIDGFAENLSGGLYKTGGMAVLCDRDTGLIFSAQDRVRDTGLINGSRLMLL